jgi:hypothetical protein
MWPHVHHVHLSSSRTDHKSLNNQN